jgi:hypothetical protein
MRLHRDAYLRALCDSRTNRYDERALPALTLYDKAPRVLQKKFDFRHSWHVRI